MDPCTCAASGEETPSLVLWRIDSGYERQVVERHQPYAWQNRDRSDPGLAVLQITLDGELTVEWQGREQTAGVGEAALFVHGEASSYFLPPPPHPRYACAYITLLGAGVREHWDDLRSRFGPVIRSDGDGGLLRLLRRLLRERHEDPLAASEEVHGLVAALYRAGWQARRTAGSPADAAIAALQAAPCQPWSLKALAARHGCSREHLTRVFVERFGSGPAAWLRARRVEKALRLLSGSDLPMAEIARHSGLGCERTLARLVEARTGRPPSAWRLVESRR